MGLRRHVSLFLALGFSHQAYSYDAGFLPTAGHGHLRQRDVWNNHSIVLEAVKQPNATGSWPINGIDMSKPWENPGDSDAYGEGNGWSIEVLVAANRTNGDGKEAEYDEKLYAQWNVNPTVINLKGPEGSFENGSINSNYTACSYVWVPSSDGYSKKDLEQLHEATNGSCNGYFSDQCVKDLKQAAVLGRCNRTSFDADYSDIPDSCEKKLQWANGMRWAAYRNLSAVEHFANDSGSTSLHMLQEFAPIFNASDEEETLDVYDRVVTTVYPVLINYFYDDGENQSDYQVFRCVRADDITPGSREPEGFGDRPNSSSRLTWQFPTLITGLFLSLGAVLLV